MSQPAAPRRVFSICSDSLYRTIANVALILLADEPTGNLDTENSRTVFDIFARLAHDGGKTVIALTHEIELTDRADCRIRLVDARVVADTARTATEPAG